MATQNTTLSILTIHFTIHPTSKVLFFTTQLKPIHLFISFSLSLSDAATLATHHSPSPQTKPQPTTTQSPPPPLQLAHFSYHNQNPTIHNQTQPDFNPPTLIQPNPYQSQPQPKPILATKMITTHHSLSPSLS